jgi:UDP-N-acetylmuramoylalanine--D-glutamate ligase
MIQNWKNKRVTVMGLGGFGGGVGVTRWLVEQGAKVLLTDKAPAEKLQPALAQLADLNVALHLGGHDQRDFRALDLVVVNPAVPESSEYLQIARGANVPITTEINLFVERCPARCVGVTGSVGKSTTTAMIGHILQEGTKVRPTEEGGRTRHAGTQAIARRTWVGGNIGKSLLDALAEIAADDLVVLELSSFQLQRAPGVRWSPHVSVVTDITPNHLDWHGTFEAYLAAKLNILRFQDPAHDAAIVHRRLDLPKLLEQLPGLHGATIAPWSYGLDGETPTATRGELSQRWENLRLNVPGRHNRENAAAALAAVKCLGVPDDVALAALTTFEALPHRLQKVVERDGVTYYDDSKSTTPEAALTALAAFEAPLLVILGGYDKGSDLRPVARAAARRAKFTACIGKTGHGLVDAIQSAGGAAEYCGDLAAAVATCRQRVRAGDVVLLSPACASWDQFTDYRERGLQFAQLARA